ncbi:hypothetical protein MVES1_001720 [Malassezia vespertilionis]|uniref:Proteasome maturation factor UMP1 n=1 Tax=Malassezia vespertilionis TaxID=2020962 RepID=A0A2N1JDK8_9BASI|nr:uncharacterized protein MVES1_001720 [Malassezia vespertilionis]PKI84637.1 hypothetical protein MVES_001619 [Malassezia vespertilionis]WFD06375.1 hypothetical protein MVES1_001720 [Malassezia vespertilionis]
MSSMQIVPPSVRTHTSVSGQDTAHAEHGVHDTMRYGLRSMHAETAASTQHPIQNRLEQWEDNQRAWKMTVQRNTYGIGMPLRTAMERKLVASNYHMPARRVANLHLDVLDGKDETISPADVLPTGIEYGPVDIHAAMERKYNV